MQDVSEKVSVDILAIPECTAAVLFSIYEVLNSVGSMWVQLTGEEEAGVHGFDARITSPIAGPYTCISGVPITPHSGLLGRKKPDIIIIPDFLLTPDLRGQDYWQPCIDWVKEKYENGSVVCSVCTGAVLLADTGLLDNKEATTHWAGCDLFKQSFSKVKLRPDLIFSAADQDHSLITTGGSASWEELCLYLVKRYFGFEAASHVAKIYLLGDRKDGQLPFMTHTFHKEHDDAIILECQAWIADHYSSPQPVSRMIEKSGLAERTFKRRFTTATGIKPVQYVQTLRVEEAKQLLETTNDSAEEISAAVGYEDSAFFRRLFKRMAGISPAKYRQKYQAIRNLGNS